MAIAAPCVTRPASSVGRSLGKRFLASLKSAMAWSSTASAVDKPGASISADCGNVLMTPSLKSVRTRKYQNPLIK